MLTMTPASLKYLQSLAAELAWLEQTHPEKTALITLAKGHLEAIRQAGSTKGFAFGTDAEGNLYCRETP